MPAPAFRDYARRVRCDPDRIDVGAREAVALLNRISGVSTRASCQGVGPHAVHTHAERAFVRFRHQLPLRFADFLVARLGPQALVEDAAIYSRWPDANQTFLRDLSAAARAYLDARQLAEPRVLRYPLPRLRTRLARQLSTGQDACVALCLDCADLVLQSHSGHHQQVELIAVGADLALTWFAAFTGETGNALDPALVVSAGWPDIVRRTQHGGFGTTFRRRWLRYRARQIAALATRQVRESMARARHEGRDVDFFYDDAYAVFTWRG